jgi:hypothetical protein
MFTSSKATTFSVEIDLTLLFDENYRVKPGVDLIRYLMFHGFSEAERFANNHQSHQIMECIRWFSFFSLTEKEKRDGKINGVFCLCEKVHLIYFLENMVSIYFKMVDESKDIPQAMESLDNLRENLLIQVHEFILETKI